jgi:L-lactate utilization protein LutB
VIAWLKPRRLLVRDLAAVVAENRELREAAVRRAKDLEAIRAALRRERAEAYETLESMLMRRPESHERWHCLNELDGIHAYLTSVSS